MGVGARAEVATHSTNVGNDSCITIALFCVYFFKTAFISTGSQNCSRDYPIDHCFEEFN